jgi:hypothetical protein
MPEMPDVVVSEIVEVDWGNDIRDRTEQRYITDGVRDTENPTPTEGDMAYIGDIAGLAALQMYTGGTWVTLLSNAGGTFSGSVTFSDGLIVENTLVEVNEGIDIAGYLGTSLTPQARQIWFQAAAPGGGDGKNGDIAIVLENTSDRGVWAKDAGAWLQVANKN